MRFFELGMLLCFGASWPASIHKSWVSRTTGGKSVFFLWLVFIGYISGIIYKIISGFDYVTWFYMANALMVVSDIALYYRNRALDLAKING